MEFPAPYVTRADAFIFSRRAFVWDGLDPSHVAIIGPSIDPFAAKNYCLTPESVTALLSAAGIQSGNGEGPGEFLREDGTTSRIRHRASLDEDTPLLPDAPLVLQVSRWDRLKVRVASRTGGIQDQIVGGVSGTLVDPTDLRAFGSAFARYIDDPELARSVGDDARDLAA